MWANTNSQADLLIKQDSFLPRPPKIKACLGCGCRTLSSLGKASRKVRFLVSTTISSSAGKFLAKKDSSTPFHMIPSQCNSSKIQEGPLQSITWRSPSSITSTQIMKTNAQLTKPFPIKYYAFLELHPNNVTIFTKEHGLSDSPHSSILFLLLKLLSESWDFSHSLKPLCRKSHPLPSSLYLLPTNLFPKLLRITLLFPIPHEKTLQGPGLKTHSWCAPE